MASFAQVEPLGLSMKNQPDIIDRIWNWWCRSDGLFVVDNDLKPILPGLQIAVDLKDNGVPPFLFCGPDSTTAQIFGRHFALNSAGSAGVPDSTYEDEVNASYKMVSYDSVPRLDFIVAEARSSRYDHFHFEYPRLIVPGRLRDGRRLLIAAACFTSPPVLLS